MVRINFNLLSVLQGRAQPLTLMAAFTLETSLMANGKVRENTHTLAQKILTRVTGSTTRSKASAIRLTVDLGLTSDVFVKARGVSKA